MKDWQKGYLLEYLLELEDFYSRHNTHSCSPFSAMKKNTIASGLYGNTLKIYEQDEKREGWTMEEWLALDEVC